MTIRNRLKDNQTQWLAWMMIVLASLAISLFFGVNYPIPDQPAEPPEPVLSSSRAQPRDPSEGPIELGTTHFSELDVAGSINYGSDDLYPLGHSTSGLQTVYGTASITGTAAAPHGLTTVTWALCTLAEDPTAGLGDAAYCTVAASSNVITVSVWQDDFVTAATETDVDVNWLVIGTP